jgi:two-component system, OmpR family, response regulator VicR
MNSSIASPTMPVVVLVVDDEPAIVDVLVMIAMDYGCQCLRARDGKEALASVQHQLPDLILTDYMMPRMNGAEFIAALQKPGVVSGALPPIILMSAAASALPPLNIAAILKKPFDLPQVEALLQRYLGELLSS